MLRGKLLFENLFILLFSKRIISVYLSLSNHLYDLNLSQYLYDLFYLFSPFNMIY